MKVRIATRGSALALTQTRWVGSELRKHWPDILVEEVVVVTEGDRITDRPLDQIGGKGLFVKEVEQAILDGRADIAVHSMKDLPNEIAAGLDLVCIPAREEAQDVLVTPTGVELDELEAGNKVGTGSLRRSCQLRAHRNDLAYVPMRGNVDTRLKKLEKGEVHGIILAAAGLNRLGLRDKRAWLIPPAVCLPAVGQGALAIEGRVDDRRLRDLFAPVEHADTRLCIEAERAYLKVLGGGCQLPIAGYARLSQDRTRLRMDALVGSPDGARSMSAGSDRYLTDTTPEARLTAAHALGEEIGKVLLDQGAGELIHGTRSESSGHILH